MKHSATCLHVAALRQAVSKVQVDEALVGHAHLACLQRIFTWA